MEKTPCFKNVYDTNVTNDPVNREQNKTYPRGKFLNHDSLASNQRSNEKFRTYQMLNYNVPFQTQMKLIEHLKT